MATRAPVVGPKERASVVDAERSTVFGCIGESGELGSPDGIKVRTEWAEAGAYVEGEGWDGVLPVGGVVDYAADGGDGVVGTDFGEGRPVETTHRPAQREKAGSIGGRGGGVAPGIEDAGTRSLKMRSRLVLLEVRSERTWALSGSERAEGPG